MRIESLHLEAYGVYTDRELVFRPDAAVHIVFGPNEAGKTSALSAIGDLLFGFPGQTKFDFKHASANLRIGARLRLANGDALEFRRRKGLKNTILDTADKPLAHDPLAPVLGALLPELEGIFSASAFACQ